MGKVVYATGIDYVSGALSKPSKKNGHKCGTYLIGTHRTAPTQNPDCTRLYIAGANRYDRTGQPSERELAARVRFRTVAAMVAERKEDLTKLSADQAAFLAQKDLADGKKTMKAFYWKICGDLYDQQNG